MRGPLVPPLLPLHRTRSQRFDDLVLDAIEHLEGRWRQELAAIDFLVEDVPPADEVAWNAEALTDGGVPLASITPGDGPGKHAGARARIVVYRRPLELRAVDRHDLSHLVHDVVVEQVAHVLGIEPGELDSPGHGGAGA